MVYCTKCGAKNKAVAERCVQCGQLLYGTPARRSMREEEVCFGGRGAWGSVVVGLVIILIGFAFLVQQMYGVSLENLGPTFLIIIGLVIIVGTIVSRFLRR